MNDVDHVIHYEHTDVKAVREYAGRRFVVLVVRDPFTGGRSEVRMDEGTLIKALAAIARNGRGTHHADFPHVERAISDHAESVR